MGPEIRLRDAGYALQNAGFAGCWVPPQHEMRRAPSPGGLIHRGSPLTMINIIELYAASNAGVLLVLLIPLVRRLMAASLPSIRFSILNKLALPLLIERRHGWSGVTRMEFALLSLYLGWNTACVLNDGVSGVMARSGQISAINMVALMLGGRTNMVIDACGIPLHRYYLIHHWVGRIATAQALLHVGLAMASQGWILDSDAVSGLVVRTHPPPECTSNADQAALPLTTILLTSPYFIRGRAFEVFLVAHKLLALTAVGGVFWHIYPGKFTNLLFPIISLSVWSITTIYRLYGRRRGYLSDALTFDHPSPGRSRCAVKFTVRVSGHMQPDPGAYVYLRFSGLPRRYTFQAHPFMIVWCEHDVELRDDARQDVTHLTFLVQPQRGLTARLFQELHFFRAWRPFQKMVSFDGPYGQDLHLERYETVILVANGMGIAGVLPYARYLALRLRHDGDIRKKLRLASTPNKAELRNSLYRDATRKVDLLWVLDFNRQEDWISDQLRALQDLDPRRVSRPPCPMA